MIPPAGGRRPAGDRAGHQFGSVPVVAELVPQRAVEIEQLGMVREMPQELPVDCLGLAQPTGEMMRHRVAERPRELRRRRSGARHASNTSGRRSEEQTSELQSLMRISCAVYCL